MKASEIRVDDTVVVQFEAEREHEACVVSVQRQARGASAVRVRLQPSGRIMKLSVRQVKRRIGPLVRAFTRKGRAVPKPERDRAGIRDGD